MMKIKITPNKGNPPGKLADAELHFTAAGRTAVLDSINDLLDQLRKDAPNQFPFKLAKCAINRLREQVTELDGLKLIGFAIWERRTGWARNVTVPARQYSVNGERRSFALLRPTTDDATAQERIRELILAAYAEYEAAAAIPTPAALEGDAR